MNLTAFLKNNIVVLLLYLAAIAVSSWFLYSYHRNDIHLYVNSFVGNRYVNGFFYYFTYLGDGRWAAVILFAIILYNVRIGLYATASFVTASIGSTALKYLFFDDENRPYFIFNYIDKHTLNLVDGVDVYIHNSFPSGHATQAFAILMCVAFSAKSQGLKVTLFFAALLTSFSRMYLSQHWLADIMAGSGVGMAAAIGFYFVFILKNRLPALDKPLSAIRRKT